MSKMRKTLALVMTMMLLAACGSSGGSGGASAPVEIPEGGYTFPLAEKAEISGLINYPAGTESEPNNRTIFKRLEEQTNVHVNWKAIQNDQWGDKIALEMANIKTLPGRRPVPPRLDQGHLHPRHAHQVRVPERVHVC